MAGVDIGASVMGIVSVSLTVVKACFEAFDLLETAQNLSPEAEFIRWKLSYEHYRLYRWYKQVWPEDDQQPNRKLNWHLIKTMLGQLQTLLERSQPLRERYKITPQEAKTNAEDGKEPKDSAQTSPTGIKRIIARLVPDFSSSTSSDTHEASTWARMRWAFTDKEKVNSLLREIVYLNDCLESLLEKTDQTFVRNALKSLLREVISRSSSSSELEIVKQLLDTADILSPDALASAASVKQIRLLLNLDKSVDEVNAPSASKPSHRRPQLVVKQLKSASLVRETTSSKPGPRELARYKSQMVLVEWKFVDPSLEEKLRKTVESLAVLLSNVTDPSFRSLHALGFIRYPEWNCYAFVFQLPGNPGPADTHFGSLAVPTLLDLYSPPYRKPSLNERSSIALVLAQTVLQLHTSGWLHKGIRSDNVLYYDYGQSTWQASAPLGPYLAGYEYARTESQDTATQMTPSSPDLDLYRHPRMRSAVRPSYTKAFDLFGLGCVFLELAFWMPLKTIFSEHGGSASSYERPNTPTSPKTAPADSSLLPNLQSYSDESLMAEVGFRAGTTLLDIIILCFHADNDTNEDARASIQTQKIIVDKLKECSY
jgi:hypothetical protein